MLPLAEDPPSDMSLDDVQEVLGPAGTWRSDASYDEVCGSL
jgi:hypothetical protein